MHRSLFALVAVVAVGPSCSGDPTPPPEQNSTCFTDTLKVTPELLAQCVARPLAVDSSGHVNCVVLEARNAATCDCTDGRSPVSHDGLADVAREDPSAGSEGWNCFCEIDQLSDAALDACRATSAPPEGVDMAGWCYVDEFTGDPELVAKCAATEAQQIRFPDAEVPANGATVFTVCCEG